MREHAMAKAAWYIMFLVPCLAHDAIYKNIDCGSSASYKDSRGQQWLRDVGYSSTGDVANVTIADSNARELQTLRYFSDGYDEKNCYEVGVIAGSKYLVRSRFHYGNYDRKNSPPTFALYFNANLWTTISARLNETVDSEIILVSLRNTLSICMAGNSPSDVPFISSLELRLLEASLYQNVLENQALLMISRLDMGSLSSENIRYPSDIYDRVWMSDYLDSDYPKVNSKNSVLDGRTNEKPPQAVTQTARIGLANSSSDFSCTFDLPRITSGRQYCTILYFAELAKLEDHDIREFNILLSSVSYNNIDMYGSPVNVAQQVGGAYISFEVYDSNRTFYGPVRIKFVPTERSTLPPILNGVEIFSVLGNLDPGTNENDVVALENIKSHFNIGESAGDACLPARYKWDWVNCNNESPPRIDAVVLSNQQLMGPLPDGITQLTELITLRLDNNQLSGGIPDLSRLTKLKILDLHGNNLSGVIPETLAKLPKLQLLLLQDNKFSGPIPSTLSSNPNLVLNTSGNPCLLEGSPCFNAATVKKKHSVTDKTPIILGVTAAVVAMIILLLAYFSLKKGKFRSILQTSDSMTSGLLKSSHQAHVLCYEDVVQATNNFSKEIGKGGMGTVYYGMLSDGQEVAVKVSSGSLLQGKTQFSNEVDILSRVHHKNLVSFIGYCTDSLKLMLIFEYMSGGTLQEHLYGRQRSSTTNLTWEKRLGIALNAAQGIEYLHTGCNPQVIHRDVKSSNILLSKELVAKVGDFGISKLFSGASHVTTTVKGTAGYVDPEYFMTNRVTEKSDVFSFGIVLLEIMCGRAPLDPELSEDAVTLIGWFRALIQNGKLEELVDPRLGGEYKLESMWKVAEIAMACLDTASANRPTMSIVAAELKEAIDLETSGGEVSYSASLHVFSESIKSR